MKTLLGPFVLRRLKADVAGQLAPKDQRLTQLSMTPIQAEMLHRGRAAPAQAGGGCWVAWSAFLPLMALSRLWSLTGLRAMHRRNLYHTLDRDTALKS